MSADTCDECGGMMAFLSPTGSDEESLYECASCGSIERLPKGTGVTKDELVAMLSEYLDVAPPADGSSNVTKAAVNEAIGYLTGDRPMSRGLARVRPRPHKDTLMCELADVAGLDDFDGGRNYYRREVYELLEYLKESPDNRD